MGDFLHNVFHQHFFCHHHVVDVSADDVNGVDVDMDHQREEDDDEDEVDDGEDISWLTMGSLLGLPWECSVIGDIAQV